tara:strand:- start:206 stop:538 length:333 start_codon:yes stop_codon:yes gene_type:complete
MEQPTKTFECTICNFTSLLKTNYERHLTSSKHKLKTNQKTADEYHCQECDYFTHIKCNYETHLLSSKHIKKNSTVDENNFHSKLEEIKKEYDQKLLVLENKLLTLILQNK